MFRKNRKKDKENSYSVEFEELAMPEVHTGRAASKAKKTPEEEICYEDLAIPEIHIRGRKRKKEPK